MPNEHFILCTPPVSLKWKAEDGREGEARAEFLINEFR